MKRNKQIKIGLLICLLSISIIGLAVPSKALNRCAWMKKGGEYYWIFGFIPGWELKLSIFAHRAYDSSCGHYYFSSHSEEYSAGTGPLNAFLWTEYSVDIDYFYCPICHKLIIITFEVHGRFEYYADSSNYYDITLTLEYDAGDNIDATFGPCYNHLVGVWVFSETSGIETS